MLRQFDRLQPAPLGGNTGTKRDEASYNLPNLYKSRLFFFLPVTDADFPSEGVHPMGTEGKHLYLKLSVEHSDFIFQPEPTDAAKMLEYHSGGKCSQALLMAQGKSSTGGSTTSTSEAQDASSNTRDVSVNLMVPPLKQENRWCCFC